MRWKRSKQNSRTSGVIQLNPSIFSGTLGLTLLACFLFFRRGMAQDQTEAAVLFTGAGLFLNYAPIFVCELIEKTILKQARAFLLGRVSVTLILLFVCIFLGKLLPNISIISWFISAIGGLLFLISIIRFWTEQTDLKVRLAILAPAVLLGIYLGGVVFTSKYHDAYFLEKLTFGPPFDLGTDTLFHACLANMIGNLGRITTGLDGTPFTAYHAGSHILFSQLCKLLSQGCLPFYVFGYPLLVIPLFFNSLCSLALELIDFNSDANKNASNYLYLPLACITIGFFPEEGKVCYLSGPFIGESYGFGLILFFLGSCLMLEFFKTTADSSKFYSLGKYIFFLLLIPALCAVITACKFSTIYLVLGICFYIFVRKKLYSNWLYTCSIVISTATSYLVYKLLAFPYQTHLDLFGYYKDMNVVSILLHAVFMYLPLWLLLILKTTALKKTKSLNFYCEIAVVFAVICFAPSIGTNLAGGATSYFLEPQYWICAVLLVACLTPSTFFSKTKTVLILSTILLMQTSFGYSKATTKALADKTILTQNNAPSSRVFIISQLQELSKLPFRERTHSIVFIPQSCKHYWNLTTPLTAPFIEPALTGMPMLDGLPPFGFTGTIYYNYAPYSYGVRRSATQDENPDTLKRNAALWGFRKLIRFDNKYMKFNTEDIYAVN